MYVPSLVTTQKIKFSIKDVIRKCDQILNGKVHFVRSDWAADVNQGT